MQPASATPGDAYLPVDTDRIVGGSRLLGAMRDLIRRKHYSIRTEPAYFQWAKRYILFHGERHPNELGEAKIVGFLSHLSVAGNVAISNRSHVVNEDSCAIRGSCGLFLIIPKKIH